MAETCITSLDDPRLDPYRQLKKTNLTRWSGLFIAEGLKVVERLLASPLRVQSVLVSHAHRGRLPDNLGEHHDVYTLAQPLAELVVGYRFHAGVLACAWRPPPETFEEWIGRTGPSSLRLGCPNTTDPDNLGALMRTAAAFGVTGLLLGRGCADAYSRRALRVSMGTAFSLAIRETASFAAELKQLQERGMSILASVLSDDAAPLSQVRPQGRCMLLVGNEAEGLDAELIDLADVKITIPMTPGIDSLNVGIAAGIILHHLTSS